MTTTVADLAVKLGYDGKGFDSGLDDANSKVGRFGSVLKLGLTAAVGGATAAAVATLKSTMNIEDALAPVMTLTGKGSEQFAILSAGIKDVIKSSPKSPEEIGASAYTILSAGITDNAKAILALRDAGKLAAAGLGSTSEATDLITSAMNSWKDANLSSTDAAKTFFGTVAAGKTTTAQLAQGFGQIAPLAASAGISLNELMAATAALTATGMPASVAYSGLRAAISNVLKPTKDAEGAAQNLGIEFNAAALKSKGLTGFIADIKAKTGGSIEAMSSLFGSVEAMNAVLTLTGPQSDAFVANLGNIATAGENLDARAKEVNDTLSNKFKIAKNVMMVNLADLGNNGINKLMDLWERWGPSLMGAVDTVKNGLAAMKAAFSGEGITSDGFVGVMERIGVAARGVVDFFVANWPKIHELVSIVVDNIRARVLALVDIFTGVFNILSFIWKHWGDDILGVVVFLFEHIIPIIEGSLAVVTNIFKIFGDLLHGRWGEVWQDIINVFLGLWEQFKGIFNLALDSLWNVVKALVPFGAGLIAGLFEGLWNNKWQIVEFFAIDLPNAIVGALWNIGTWLVGLGVQLITGLIRALWDNKWQILSFFLSLPGSIWQTVSDIASWLYNSGINLMIGFINGIRSMAGAIVDEALAPIHAAINAVKGFLGMRSPSRLMYQIGALTVEGMAMGMRQAAPTVLKATHLVTAALPTAGPQQASTTNYGGPGVVNIHMPAGSNGDDVVRALRNWQDRNGALPIRIAS